MKSSEKGKTGCFLPFFMRKVVLFLIPFQGNKNNAKKERLQQKMAQRPNSPQFIDGMKTNKLPTKAVIGFERLQQLIQIPPQTRSHQGKQDPKKLKQQQNLYPKNLRNSFLRKGINHYRFMRC